MSLEEKQAFIAETVDAYERHVNRGFIGYRKSVTEAGQFAALEWSGEGALLHDLLGREYIDCLGGYGIFSAGINHPKVIKAVTDQMQRMALNSQELLEPWRAALAKLLAAVTPGDLQNCFFINNGTDAIEGAIKLARLYTKRNTFISTLGGFHGKSMGSLSLMGKASFREPFLGGLQDVRFVPFGDALALETELAKADAVGTPIAAFVLEPVQGEAGGCGTARRLSPGARELCTRFGALLIADEIQTGMGRTGKLWGVDHWEVQPDIMCLGKSIGGGVMPLSAFISTPAIWEVLIPNPIIHSTTFGGNPIACAAGHRRDRGDPGGGSRPARPRRKATTCSANWADSGSATRRSWQDVHGKGLLIGMEFPASDDRLEMRGGPVQARGAGGGHLLQGPQAIRIEPRARHLDGAAQGDAEPAGGHVQGNGETTAVKE